jgi:phosphate transport system permease protein
MEMGRTIERSAQQAIAERLSSNRTNIFKRPRPFEGFIRIALFCAAALSILTTTGIVVVLGTESFRFFSSMGFQDTNHEVARQITLTDTSVQLSEEGGTMAVGDVLRINEEQLRIIRKIAPDTYEVERGYNGSPVGVHEPSAAVYKGEQVTVGEFLTGTVWQPQASEFGVLPLLLATLTTSTIAMLVAGPIGLGAAVYLSEYASPRVRSVLKPTLEILAGVPTVVYGFFALTFVTPLLRNLVGENTVGIYNMAAAGIVMGIMIVPTIASISEDALSAVPRALREGAYGLGSTRLETVFRVLLPAALSGILAAFILGISRAVGETMIVAIASGAGPNFTINPFAAAETMTGHIARISTGDLSFNSIDYNSLFAIGLTLFIITLGLNLLSNYIRNRFREVYQ